jgi:cytochrome c biogenesis protein CcmG/thiol:disulfide interchange protein DsbE
MKRSYFIPLAAVLALTALLGRSLQLDARELPSALVGRPAPDFRLTRVEVGQGDFTPSAMRGKVWLLNVWASWCAPCRQELPALQALSRSVPIVGLNYKDQPQQAREWLERNGNSYVANALDSAGKIGIDYGITGVPETFVIDRSGVVRLRHAGPITPELVRDKLMPLLKELDRGR